MKIMKIFKRAAMGFGILIMVLIVARYVYVKEIGNFHEVSKGMVYRSAQLDRDQLLEYMNKYGIKSILNLRGKKEDKQWYKDEMEVAGTKGVVIVSFRLSPEKIIPPSVIAEIIDLMKKAPKPILVHCKAGADRSGLVAAVWKLAVEKLPPKEAHKQLSLYYGHVPYLWSKTKAMDESFWNYVSYLRSQKQSEKDAQLRHRIYCLTTATQMACSLPLL